LTRRIFWRKQEDACIELQREGTIIQMANALLHGGRDMDDDVSDKKNSSLVKTMIVNVIGV